MQNNISYVELPVDSQSATSATEPSSAPANPATNPNISQNNIDISNPFNYSSNIPSTATQQTAPATSPTQTQSATQPATATKPVTFDDIVAKKNFVNLSKDLFDKLGEGDVSAIQDSLQSAMRNVYRTAVEDVSTLMEARLKEYQAKTLDQVNNSKFADAAVAELKSAIPFAGDPAIEPVAKNVLAGYLRKGMTRTEAVGATAQYFSNLAEQINSANQSKEPESQYRTGKDSWDDLFNFS